MTETTTTKKTRKRRTPEQMIKDLEKEIERVKQRADSKALREDPAVKLTTQAVRALNKALVEATEPELVEALNAAKSALAGYLESKGLRVPKPGKRGKGGAKAA